jgi:hypothetical protein
MKRLLIGAVVLVLAGGTIGLLLDRRSSGLPTRTHPYRYTDPRSGWSLTVPAGFHLQRFDTLLSGRTEVSGASVSNFGTEAFPGGTGLRSLRGFPPDGVLFMLWRNEGGLAFVNAHDDTTLPLSLGSYRAVDPYVGGAEPHPLFRSVIEGGAWFASAVWVGARATSTDRRAIEGIIPSIRFPAMRPFTASPEATALVLDRVSAYPVRSVTAIRPSELRQANDFDGLDFFAAHEGLYLVHGPHGFYAVPMTAQSPHHDGTGCHVAADPATLTFGCSNGAEWNRFVRAIHRPAFDDEIHGFWLDVSPGHDLVERSRHGG